MICRLGPVPTMWFEAVRNIPASQELFSASYLDRIRSVRRRAGE